MRRRDLLGLVGGAAVLPLAARAQQPSWPVIGFLSGRSPEDSTQSLAGFRRGLSSTGFIEGRNLLIEFRWADGDYGRLPAMARELIGKPVSVVFASGGDVPSQIVKATKTTIPIVFLVGGDPVRSGLVTTLGRPDGNATGVTMFGGTLNAKRVQLLHELIPQASNIGVLANSNNPRFNADTGEILASAKALGLETFLVSVAAESEFEIAFNTLADKGVKALLVAADPMFNDGREALVALAARYSIPAIYHAREIATVGGLISYGANIPDVYRQAGVYTGRILQGVKPTNLPVLQPLKFELIVNLKTARTIGVEIPTSILLRADEVIE